MLSGSLRIIKADCQPGLAARIGGKMRKMIDTRAVRGSIGVYEWT
jgi:hypothetical protein